MIRLALCTFLSTYLAPQVSQTAYLQAEVETGGLTRQCVYEAAGSIYTFTVSVAALCPVTILVPSR